MTSTISGAGNLIQESENERLNQSRARAGRISILGPSEISCPGVETPGYFQ
jgi:hypothetical protein